MFAAIEHDCDIILTANKDHFPIDDLDKKSAGLLVLSEGGRIKEVYGAPPLAEAMTEETRRDLMFELSRLASRWAIYGFTPNKINLN